MSEPSCSSPRRRSRRQGGAGHHGRRRASRTRKTEELKFSPAPRLVVRPGNSPTLNISTAQHSRISRGLISPVFYFFRHIEIPRPRRRLGPWGTATPPESVRNHWDKFHGARVARPWSACRYRGGVPWWLHSRPAPVPRTHQPVRLLLVPCPACGFDAAAGLHGWRLQARRGRRTRCSTAGGRRYCRGLQIARSPFPAWAASTTAAPASRACVPVA